MKKKIGLARSLLYYYYKDLWIYFFKYLDFDIVTSTTTNKEILSNGEKLAVDESCLALKLFLGHLENLKNKCDYILVPRLFSIKENEGVCTNFSCLYDLAHNILDNTNIITYNIDLKNNENELLGFLKMGRSLGISYIKSYKAYKFAKRKSLEIRFDKENKQKEIIRNNNMKILLAGHPYNIYDDLVGKQIINYLEKLNISIIYSDRIPHNLIDMESKKLSTDLYWTHSKEVMASINYYKEKVDGIILLSSFPCGPDSLSNDLICRKIKNIPILTLLFEDLNSDVGLMTRLESFFDILKQKENKYETNH